MSLISRFVTIAAPLALLLAFLVPGDAEAGDCERKVARAVSVQGKVEARSEGEAGWRPVRRNDAFCPGDSIRVLSRSRASIALANETIVRLDQNSTLNLRGTEGTPSTPVGLLRGIAYFFSRTPRSLTVTTPFVNATIEGTEFLVRVDEDKTSITVYEGRVAAVNEQGRVSLAGGESAETVGGKGPVIRIVARPRDAVQWALYYPPVAPAPPAGLESAPPADLRSRAAALLAVGRVEEAKTEIEAALAAAPQNADALALLAVIAVAQNEKEQALSLAGKAAASDPGSSGAGIALSYARQASFDIAGARTVLSEVVKRDPGNALAWARLAELHMSFGDLDSAIAAAGEAVSRNGSLSRARTVLGFAYLARVETKEAAESFEKAIDLDEGDPLPRLGLGLARIRDGRLEEGRREIEIAVSLDPGNSLVRSYLGKAYYEEKRDKASAEQFAAAEALDPRDPTPHYYDAIRKQSVGRPVEALHDLQQSIALNDNRAVYRSKLLLDEDLAARETGVARIYDDLGFQQLALVEGHRSLDADPAAYSAHLFLADAYAAMPRHEIARVSELLQGQLLQPINLNPVPPRLAESRSFLRAGAGTGSASFNEYDSLFERDRLGLQVAGVVGNNRTLGEEIVQSGVAGRFSYSLGQLHFQTDGFRANDDFSQNILDGFVQYALSYKTSVQAEARRSLAKFGDLTLRFDPNDVLPNQRETSDTQTYRVGIRHAVSPSTDILGSFIYVESNPTLKDFFPDVYTLSADTEDRGFIAEAQSIFRSEAWNAVAGIGSADIHRKETDYLAFVMDPGPPPFIVEDAPVYYSKNRHSNAYLYLRVRRPEKAVLTLGASIDAYKDQSIEKTRFNPKAGVSWTPLSGTTLRAAVLRATKRTLVTDQTLEPTQVAGFNQFFDDTNGTDSWLYGVGADQKFSENVSGGAEYYRRDLEVPVTTIVVTGGTSVNEVDVEQRLGRAYLYWTPHPRWSLSAEYRYEKLVHGLDFLIDGIERVTTETFPAGVNYFHPCGISARVKTTYVAQKGAFVPDGSFPGTPGTPGSDYFWLFDASLGYRLPKRLGLVTVEGRNLFDRSFKFQDTDHNNPTIEPERTVLFRLTLAL